MTEDHEEKIMRIMRKKEQGSGVEGEKKEMRLKLRRLEPKWPPDMRETRTQIVAGGR